MGFIAFTMSITIGCKQKERGIPKPPLSKDTFVKVLYELHFTDAACQQLVANKDSNWQVAWGNYKSVFSRHHITYSDFNKTFMYYCYYSGQLDDIYAHMLDTLSIQQAQLQKK